MFSRTFHFGILFFQRIFDLNQDGTSSSSNTRLKRQVFYEPVYARCRCLSPLKKECVPSTNKWEPLYSTCLCYLDVHSGNIWPCYDVEIWKDHRCANCSTTNACPFPPRPADPSKGETDEPCTCQSISNFCVKLPEGPIRMWEGYTYGVYETTMQPETPAATSPKFRPEEVKRKRLNKIGSIKCLTKFRIWTRKVLRLKKSYHTLLLQWTLKLEEICLTI